MVQPAEGGPNVSGKAKRKGKGNDNENENRHLEEVGGSIVYGHVGVWGDLVWNLRNRALPQCVFALGRIPGNEVCGSTLVRTLIGRHISYIYMYEKHVHRRLLFAGAVSRQPDGRLPNRLVFGELVGGKNPGRAAAGQSWEKCRKGKFKAFGSTHGYIKEESRVFGVPKAL